MKKASITEAKNQLSALIAGLASGSPVLIVDRGHPVARLEPVRAEQKGRLSRLVREGLVRPPTSVLPRNFFNEPPPSVKSGASAVAVLLQERREGR